MQLLAIAYETMPGRPDPAPVFQGLMSVSAADFPEFPGGFQAGLAAVYDRICHSK